MLGTLSTGTGVDTDGNDITLPSLESEPVINGVVDVNDITLPSPEYKPAEVSLAKLGVARRVNAAAAASIEGGSGKIVSSSLAELSLNPASSAFGSLCMGNFGETGTMLSSITLSLLRRRCKKKIKARNATRSRKPTTPPTTAPIIVPVDNDLI